ncbi:sodium- and chloride-dependent GABA transporter 2-like [Dendronephthya gigantea]|uniref:sodium- and chloride-dependent GABA transporter 2-like n=1 Tax=Dendronephthya gigantea TaxID=151771 RepID=UPI00106AFE18|nr:sodium- and chloride-dependent GABA transporter 2-like [Dendronephthya gigantea]
MAQTNYALDADEKLSDTSDDETERDSWGNKAEFLLASIGLAVGLGNVWRFPYLCQKNGGGAFLIPYIIFMFIEGVPLMLLEFAIGQKMRCTAVKLWKNIHPALLGIGVCCISVSMFLCVYYVVVIAWCILYFFSSMRSSLPWQGDEVCGEKIYGGYNALKDKANALARNISLFANIPNETAALNETRRMLNTTQHKIDTFKDCCVIDPQQWYFYTHTLEISTDIEDYSKGLNGKLVGCFILAWVIVYICVVKGIKTTGKAVYFTATFPYVILIILFFRGVTLEGAGNGLKTFFTPEWSRLNDAKIWKDAATQMFFTLSLGFGALSSFASFMPYKNQCMRDAYTVVFVNCGTSIFAGIVVFSILGYREIQTGIDAAQVGSGPGLAFMTFSDALLQLDVPQLWSILFFFMLILLGIDSEFGTLEASVGPLIDLGLFPKTWRREICAAVVVVFLLLVGLCMVAGNGFYVFQIFDDNCATIPLLVIALFECIAVAWVYGNHKFADDIEDMTGKRPWIGWMICWKYISPLALFIVLIATFVDLSKSRANYAVFVGCEQDPFSSKYPGDKKWVVPMEYPGWGQFLVAVVILCSTLPIIIFLVWKWPKNWKTSFYNTFCSGINNYLPDPKPVHD